MSKSDAKEIKPDSSDRPMQNRANNSTTNQLHQLLDNLKISQQQIIIALIAIILLIILLVIALSGQKKNSSNESEAHIIPITTPVSDATTNDLLHEDPESSLSANPALPSEIVIAPMPIEAIDESNHNESIHDQMTPPDRDHQSTLNSTLPETENAPLSNSSLSGTSLPPDEHKANPVLAEKHSPKLPNGKFTLQLSGATQPNSLEYFAKKQKLTTYWIYETRRNNKPWFVLIYGSYATSHEANSAIAKLPYDVRAKKPWVKPITRVHKEAKQD